MEFFKSKYYTPLTTAQSLTSTDMVESHDQLVIRDTAYIMNTKKMSAGNMSNAILDRYTDALPTISNYRVDYNHIKNTWVLVTDLQGFSGKFDVSINDDEDIDSIVGAVYYHPDIECFMTYDHYRASIFDKYKFRTNTIRVPYLIPRDGIFEALLKDGAIVKHERVKRSRIGVLIQDRNGLDIKYNDLPELQVDIPLMYGDEFKDISDKIIAYVSEPSHSGLIILHGEPGTGKTSYIKWLSGVATRPMVYVPPDLVSVLTKPAFIDFLLENRGLTFIVEDAEASLSPRIGSSNSIVSSILNLSNGILGDILQSQFICTFNTPLTNIDEALLRPGRLLVKHQFDKLSIKDANRYLKSVNSELVVDKPMSLAELTNLNTSPVIGGVKPKLGFGFNR